MNSTHNLRAFRQQLDIECFYHSNSKCRLTPTYSRIVVSCFGAQSQSRHSAIMYHLSALAVIVIHSAKRMPETMEVRIEGLSGKALIA